VLFDIARDRGEFGRQEKAETSFNPIASMSFGFALNSERYLADGEGSVCNSSI